MQIPVQISFKGLPHSAALEQDIRKKAGKLEQLYPGIISCHVVLAAAHHRRHQGNLYSVRIRVHVPEKEIVASHDRHDKQAHEDAYVAVRDAFDAVARRLEDYSRVRRGQVKAHAAPSPEGESG